MANGNTTIITVILIILAVAVIAPDFVSKTIQSITGAEDVTPTGEDIGKACVGDTGVTVTLNAVDKYDTGVSLSASNYYKISNAGLSSLKSVSDAGTFEASAGNKVDYIMQLRTSQGISHYPVQGEETLPCAPTHEITVKVAPAGAGNMSYTLFSSKNGNLLVSATQNQSIDTGESVTMVGNLKINAETEMPYGGVIVVDYSKGNYSADKLTMVVDGNFLKKAALPLQHTLTTVAKNAIAFELPAFIGGITHSWELTLAAKDGQDPRTPGGGGAGTQEGSINITIYDYVLFANDQDEIVKVVEDPDTFVDVGDVTTRFGFWVV